MHRHFNTILGLSAAHTPYIVFSRLFWQIFRWKPIDGKGILPNFILVSSRQISGGKFRILKNISIINLSYLLYSCNLQRYLLEIIIFIIPISDVLQQKTNNKLL